MRQMNERNLTFNLLDPNQIRLTLCYTNYCPPGLAHGFSILHCKPREICLILIFFRCLLLLQVQLSCSISITPAAAPINRQCSARFLVSSARFFEKYSLLSTKMPNNCPKSTHFDLKTQYLPGFSSNLLSFSLKIPTFKKIEEDATTVWPVNG